MGGITNAGSMSLSNSSINHIRYHNTPTGKLNLTTGEIKLTQAFVNEGVLKAQTLIMNVGKLQNYNVFQVDSELTASSQGTLRNYQQAKMSVKVGALRVAQFINRGKIQFGSVEIHATKRIIFREHDSVTVEHKLLLDAPTIYLSEGAIKLEKEASLELGASCKKIHLPKVYKKEASPSWVKLIAKIAHARQILIVYNIVRKPIC